jgi:GTPase SAR1 family protein
MATKAASKYSLSREDDGPAHIKLLVLGLRSSGKGSLCRRYCNNYFDLPYKSELSFDYYVKVPPPPFPLRSRSFFELLTSLATPQHLHSSDIHASLDAFIDPTKLIDVHSYTPHIHMADSSAPLAPLEPANFRLHLHRYLLDHPTCPVYIPRTIYRNAEGAIIVFDQTSPASFERALQYKTVLESKHTGKVEGACMPLVLVASKCDLARHKDIPAAAAMSSWAASNGKRHPLVVTILQLLSVLCFIIWHPSHTLHCRLLSMRRNLRQNRTPSRRRRRVCHSHTRHRLRAPPSRWYFHISNCFSVLTQAAEPRGILLTEPAPSTTQDCCFC